MMLKGELPRARVLAHLQPAPRQDPAAEPERDRIEVPDADGDGLIHLQAVNRPESGDVRRLVQAIQDDGRGEGCARTARE